jgi:hypothetical protein
MTIFSPANYDIEQESLPSIFYSEVERNRLLPTSANASPKQHSSEYNSHDDKNPSVHGRASAWTAETAASSANLRQNKGPRTHFESGANVDQPSPECCSIWRIDRFRRVVNGYRELRFGTNEVRSEAWKLKSRHPSLIK